MKYTMPIPLLIVFVTLIALGLYDLALVVFKGTGSTISNYMVDAGIKSPFWICVLSMVLGHLCFGMSRVCKKCGSEGK